MTAGRGDDKARPECYRLFSDETALENYRQALGLRDHAVAVNCLACSLSLDRGWSRFSEAALMVSFSPVPSIAALGRFSGPGESWIRGQASSLTEACRRLIYIDHKEAGRRCLALAEALVGRLGAREVRRRHFLAIPRGGYSVLGILAYILDIRHSRLGPSPAAGEPLIIVDDCALTGRRFSLFNRQFPGRDVVFATLFSHPRLRTALEAEEENVSACVSAADLRDHRNGDISPEVLESRWMDRLGERRYMVRSLDNVCFAWSEPDRLCWDEATGRVIPGWHILPPGFCLKNRPGPSRVRLETRWSVPDEREVFFGHERQYIHATDG